jgi:hypothetical protein
MNGKKIACIVLLMIVAVFAYLGQVLHKNAEAKREAATLAENDAITAKTELSQLEKKVTDLRTESEEVRRFLLAWTQYADKVQLQSDVETTIQASIRNAGLVALTTRFEVRETRADPLIPKVVRASITLGDDYAKTINWMGEIERKLPLSRLMSCKISGGDNGRQVHSEVIFEIPLPNLKAAAPIIVKA